MRRKAEEVNLAPEWEQLPWLGGQGGLRLWTPEADVSCMWLGPSHFVPVLGTTTLDTDFKVKET